MPKRAILAGGGVLPQLLLEVEGAVLVTFEGTPVQARADQVIPARFEQLATLFETLHAHGVRELCLAGAMRRPTFDPTALDAGTAALLPRLMGAMAQGDDGLLRAVIALLEEQGFTICAPHDIRPDLLAAEGVLAGEVSDAMCADATRAAVWRPLTPRMLARCPWWPRGRFWRSEDPAWHRCNARIRGADLPQFRWCFDETPQGGSGFARGYAGHWRRRLR